MDKTGFVLHLL